MVLNETVKKRFIAGGAKEEKVTVVGDLAKDGIKLSMSDREAFNHWGLDSKYFIISLLPGSRPEEIRYMTPFFLEVAELIKKEFPLSQFLLILSPFVSKKELNTVNEESLSKTFSGVGVKLKKESGQWELITKSGLEALVVEEKRYEAINISHLIITIPGTNTLESTYLGTPMLVVIPLNKPEVIPLDGLAGLVGGLPIVGSLIKRQMVKYYSKRIKFAAIPNIRADREIIPEIRGIIEPADVAKEVVELLKSPTRLTQIKEELRKIAKTEGAAGKVADVILEIGAKCIFSI